MIYNGRIYWCQISIFGQCYWQKYLHSHNEIGSLPPWELVLAQSIQSRLDCNVDHRLHLNFPRFFHFVLHCHHWFWRVWSTGFRLFLSDDRSKLLLESHTMAGYSGCYLIKRIIMVNYVLQVESNKAVWEIKQYAIVVSWIS